MWYQSSGETMIITTSRNLQICKTDWANWLENKLTDRRHEWVGRSWSENWVDWSENERCPIGELSRSIGKLNRNVLQIRNLIWPVENTEVINRQNETTSPKTAFRPIGKVRESIGKLSRTIGEIRWLMVRTMSWPIENTEEVTIRENELTNPKMDLTNRKTEVINWETTDQCISWHIFWKLSWPKAAMSATNQVQSVDRS